MSRSSSTLTATRAATMYSSSSSSHGHDAPTPAPRPKSDHFAAPRRTLPPPPPPLPTAESMATPVLPRRPIPTAPAPLPSTTSSTVTPPRRTLPPPPPAPTASTAVSNPSDARSTLRPTSLRPASITSLPKPDRPVPSLPPRHDDPPSSPTKSSLAPTLAPGRRWPPITVGLAKPPITLPRPPSIASVPTPPVPDRAKSPIPEEEEQKAVLPKRPVHAHPFLPSTAAGADVEVSRHAVLTPITQTGLPRRMVPPAPAQVEFPKQAVPSTAVHSEFPLRHVLARPAAAEFPQRAVPTFSPSTHVPKRVAPTPPAPVDLPKRVVPPPPAPVELPKRVVPTHPTPLELPKRAVPTLPTPAEHPRRDVPIQPVPVELPRRAVPKPPGQTEPAEPQQEIPPPIPGRSVSQLLKTLQNGQFKDESSTPAPSPQPLPPSKPRRLPPAPARTAEPAPPTLPLRPALPARPTPPQRPTLPHRPELPQRPTLPKRPEPRVAHEHNFSSHASSSLHSSTTTANGYSSHSEHKSSGYSSSSYSSTKPPCSRHDDDDDAIAILARSEPVMTPQFNGERLDLTMADFSVMDDHARACPKFEEESIARLSYYLTLPFPGDQVAQLRTIFTWIAHNINYNMAGFLSGNRGDNSAEGVLRNRTGVCAGFANLFSALADQQQLGVTQVTGMARGYGIEIGGESLGGGHAWSAVTINGECLLIDSTWGAGVDDPATGTPKMFKPFYFLMRPEHIIYTHWPSCAEEQFLSPPIDVEVYRALPGCTAGSWALGISPRGKHTSHTVRTDDDYFEVEIRLQKREGDGAVPYAGAHLDWKPTAQRVNALCHWTREDDESVVMTIKCFCPTTGSGNLVVFGRAAGATGNQGEGVIQYKVVNGGTGLNAQPLMRVYGVQGFSFSILEPITEQVQSGVMQRILVRLHSIEPGCTPRPQLMVEGSYHRDNLKEIEPNLFELQRVLNPGQYRIAYPTTGSSFSFMGTFSAV